MKAIKSALLALGIAQLVDGALFRQGDDLLRTPQALREQSPQDSTQVKETLPVEVNVGGLVNSFNGQIQKLGDNVTRLDNQLQIIKGNEERNRKSCKAELERSTNESKLLEEEVERSRIESKLLKEENYRLKKESMAIKAENEKLKMKLEATSHKTGIPQGTTSRPVANATTLGFNISNGEEARQIEGLRKLPRSKRSIEINSEYAEVTRCETILVGCYKGSWTCWRLIHEGSTYYCYPRHNKSGKHRSCKKHKDCATYDLIDEDKYYCKAWYSRWYYDGLPTPP